MNEKERELRQKMAAKNEEIRGLMNVNWMMRSKQQKNCAA